MVRVVRREHRQHGAVPDFVLVHPEHGLLVLEVKDWSVKNLSRIGEDAFVVGGRSCQPPMMQARRYVFKVVDRCTTTHLPRWSYGVVFPNITRAQLNASINGTSMAELMPSGRILTRDDLVPVNRRGTPDESACRALERRVAAMNERPRASRMSVADFDALRRAMDPSVIVPGKTHTYGDGVEHPAVISVQQERASKSVGEGHRLMHGIAGSGKTLVMLHRAHHLRQKHPDWRVLFVSYNLTLIN
jgi:hypothetical protein